VLGDESARSVRDRVVDDDANTETPVDDFEKGAEASCWRLRTKYAALLLLHQQALAQGARAALEVAGAICA